MNYIKKEKKNRLMPALITLMLLLSMVTIPTISAADITVPVDHATIQAAIDAATAGDTIIVSAGTYTENLVIDKALTLKSVDGAATTIIDASGTTETGQRGAIQIAATVCDVTIGGTDVGFTIKAPNAGNKYGIEIGLNCDHARIQDNIISGAVQVGIHIWGHTGDAHEDIVIRDNTITSTLTEPVGECYGIITAPISQTLNLFGDACLIDGNDISGFSGCAIYLDGLDGTSTLLPIVISNNILYDNTRHGLVVIGSEVSITGNTIYGNTLNGIAIAGESTTNIDVEENNIYSNTEWGIKIYSGTTATDITIQYNDIYSNIVGGLSNGGTGTCPATLNYWGHTSGPYHATSNPAGQGDNVSDNVDYRPWRDVEGTLVCPGVNEWGDATIDLVYDTTYADGVVKINTSTWTNGTYYLYYPSYNCTGVGPNADSFSWDGPYMVGIRSVHVIATQAINAIETSGSSISFNRSGMWIFDTDGTSHSGDDPDSYAGYIWVNTSTEYSISSIADFEYGSAGSRTITVDTGNDTGCMISIIAPDNTTIYHKWRATSASESLGIIGNFTMAGDYKVRAYRDMDAQTEIYLYQDGETDYEAYNNTYGSGANFPSEPGSAAEYYSYTYMGPWDPPEKNATEGEFTVTTGEPNAVAVPGNNTMYWSFEGEVNITIVGYDGEELTGDDADLNLKIYNSDDEEVTSYLNNVSNIDKGYIHINADPSTTSDTWGKTNTDVWGENGTWYAYIYKDINGDGNEEWNTTVEWTVTSSPGLQFKWIDDDGVISDDNNNDGVIPEVPDFDQQPLDIQFQLINDEHDNYGDVDPTAAKKNITISGDALFVGSLDKLPGVSYLDGTWTVSLIPLMKLNGGEITISADWESYGSVTETLTIGGTNLNGSIVTISPSEFIIDENVTLTVTVKGPTGYPYPNAMVKLYWINDSGGLQGLIDSTTKGNTAGEYTFLFNKTQQTENQTLSGNPWAGGDILAPRNLSAYVDLTNVGYGYALGRMKPQSDLEVEISKDAVMAGEKTSFYVNVSIVDSTEQPLVDSGNPLQVAIYDAEGDRMTLDASFGSIRNTDLDDTNNSIKDYFLKPGVYTLYAYNNTHDSVGHNTTLTVKAVDVTCDKGEFIWNVDKNISATFTVTYYGDPINGTLKLYNITDVGTYNKTWVNESDTGNDTITLKVTNGIVTMYNVTANYLPSNKAQMNITFMFKPETTGGEFAETTDVVLVKIPDVSVSPSSLSCNKLAMLDVTTTGRGVGLPNVWVSIEIPGLTGGMNTTTDTNGKATFVFTPPTTGNIIIKIENRTSDTKVPVTSWALYLDAPPQANENEDFTITVRNDTAAGVVIEGAAVLFNRVTKTTDSSGQAIFTAPAVTLEREYTILTTKEGYAEDTGTITIINVPVLIIVPPSESPTTGSAFGVTIADDLGNAIIGATVTLNDKNYTSGAQGIATLIAPSEKGDYTITASKAGFKTFSTTITIAEGGIPGFELLTLIAAIGVAFILLKRRRN